MPLHDWSDDAGWDGFHLLWISHLFHAVKPQLPADFRAYLGSVPTLGIAAARGKPDVAVRHWLEEPSAEAAPSTPQTDAEQPDVEIATIALDPQRALYVTYRGRLVSAIELISPGNKDRPSSRTYYLSRYLGYLKEGAHLLLVDVHRKPLNFSFADALAEELQIEQPTTTPPLAVTYRVGEPAASGGRMLAIWRRSLHVGEPLPTMQLPLTVHSAIPVDLEATYHQAAADSYLA